MADGLGLKNACSTRLESAGSFSGRARWLDACTLFMLFIFLVLCLRDGWMVVRVVCCCVLGMRYGTGTLSCEVCLAWFEFGLSGI